MKKIKELLKNVHGDVLAIGLSEEEESFLSNNSNITDIATLHNNKNLLKEAKTKIKSKEKNISIKKLRKKFKKNRIDFTICNIDDVSSYLKYIVKDMVFFTKDSIYLYFEKEEALKEKLYEMFHRYQVEIKEEEKENKTYFLIKVNDKKKNKMKDRFYLIKDTFDQFLELIRNFITY